MTEATTGSTATGNEGASADAGAAAGAATTTGTGADTGAAAAATGGATGGQAAAATLASGAQATDAGKAAAATTADTTATVDWRTRIAGDDKPFLKTLERYATEADFGKAHRNLQTKVSSGELKRGLPPNATPEELAAWRKESGIPDKWEEYKLSLADGIVPGEADKPVLDHFKQFAHKNNINPDTASQMASWYYTVQDALASQRYDKDLASVQEGEEVLRSEWREDYRANKNIAGTVRDGMPEDFRNDLLVARMPSGKLVGNDPRLMKWLANIGRAIDPEATLVPAGTPNIGQAVDNEIAQIEKTMRDDSRTYWNDEKMQSRYRDLLDAREKRSGSRAA